MPTPTIDYYCEILRNSKNLILTGAPGTGKTHLAKEIAAKMILGENSNYSKQTEDNPLFKSHCGFVQFHPSYDYTDFMEGLRPESNKFQRRDGIFKSFCMKALNSINSRNRILNIPCPSASNNSSFTITNIGETDIKGYNYAGQEFNIPIDSFINVINTQPESLSDVKKVIEDAYLSSYIWAIYIFANKNNINLKEIVNPYVFIIDEINRGELPKIFGELFFSLDPGYRGVKGRITTQYQNLIKDGDAFKEGFYIPENVYIIGTMNDIDRGVESMDFAIRRRFTWVEVKAEDRVSMLDMLEDPKLVMDAKQCMNSLNTALKAKDIGLTSAYDIGPAYFLKLKQFNGDFEKLWEYHIKGIVTEYLRGTRGIEEKVSKLKSAFFEYKNKTAE